jgi:uncharacterized membrane protein
MKGLSRFAFATGMLALGATVVAFGDFAQTWVDAPVWIPAHSALAYASAALMILCGAGLLWSRTERPASWTLFCYWALLVVFLELPAVVKHPLIEVAWQGIAHFGVILAGASLLATTDARAVGVARLLFGLAMIPIALAHFVYPELTTPLVPKWVPVPVFWTYFTGAAMFGAAAAALLGIQARLAAALQTVLFAMFTFLVWPPLLLKKPSPFLWSELTISWAICAATWVVAANLRAPSRT